MTDKTLPTVETILTDAARRLKPRKITCEADRDVGRLEAELLLAHVLKRDRTWLIAHREKTLTAKQKRRFSGLVHRREKREPIAYLIGKKDFFGRPFEVTRATLVPRPETEVMIDLSCHSREGGNPASTVFWDVGTGSGAIAVTLAAECPTATVLATDISERALAVAKKNAKTNGVSKRVTFLKSNLLQPAAYRWLSRHAKTHDSLVICANLPYLPVSDQKTLDADVVKFEPRKALFSGEDGLDLIRRFLGQLSRHLSEWNFPQAKILLEFDPPQTKKLLVLSEKLFPRARCRVFQDLAGRDRVLEITPTL